MQAIATASGTTGFTLPGMMLLPGWSAGSAISPRPARGPLAIQRTSPVIFSSAAASPRSAPCSSSAASGTARLAKGLRLGRNASPVRSASRAAKRARKSRCVLAPVPTPVAPCAISSRRGSAASMRSRASVT